MIRVKDWPRFQHFHNRRPPWIKLYRDILDDPEWHTLDGDSAKYLTMMWLIASEDETRQGTLPEEKKLAFRLRITESRLNSILSKLSHWLIQDDITPISGRYQSDTPEGEGEGEGEKETETEYEFVKFKPNEYQKLVAKFGEVDAKARIEKLNNYLGSTGKRYKSHYHTILNWASKDPKPASSGTKANLCSFPGCGKKATSGYDGRSYCHQHFEEAMV